MREKTFNGKTVKVVANIMLEPSILGDIYGYRVWYSDHYLSDAILTESMFTRGGFVEGNYDFSDDGIYTIDENSVLLRRGFLSGTVDIVNSKIKNLRFDRCENNIRSYISDSTVNSCFASNVTIDNSVIDGANCLNSSMLGSYVHASCLTHASANHSYLHDATLENICIVHGEIIDADIKSPACIEVTSISAMNEFDYTEIIGIGSEGSMRILFAYHDFDEKIRIKCGCWRGTIEEFEERVKRVYNKSDDPYTEYMKAIEYINVKMSHPGKNIGLPNRGKKFEEFFSNRTEKKLKVWLNK